MKIYIVIIERDGLCIHSAHTTRVGAVNAAYEECRSMKNYPENISLYDKCKIVLSNPYIQIEETYLEEDLEEDDEDENRSDRSA